MSFFSFFLAKPETLKVAWTWLFTTDLKSPHLRLCIGQKIKLTRTNKKYSDAWTKQISVYMPADVLTGLQICDWAFHMVNSQKTARKWIKTKNTCEGRTEFLGFANWIKICRFVKSSLSSLRKLFHDSRELQQSRRRQRQKPHKFAFLTMKNSIFARFARAFFIFWHFEDILVLSTTWNDLFCRCVDNVSIWWQTLNFVFLSLKHA